MFYFLSKFNETAVDKFGRRPIKDCVLLHGLLGSHLNMRGFGRTIHSENVYVPDLINHGQSERSEDMSFKYLADCVFKLMDSLYIKNFSVIGHSWGAKVGMSCALMDPTRIDHLVSLDMAPIDYFDILPNEKNLTTKDILEYMCEVCDMNLKTRREFDEALEEKIPYKHLRAFLMQSVHETPDRVICNTNLEVIKKNFREICGWPFDSEVYKGRSYFTKGERSAWVPQEANDPILKHFPNTRIPMSIVIGAGHWVHSEKPMRIADSVNRFLLDRKRY
eukprot:GHVL01020837.1.p1 GENE.GHVL01020837.1~~GHVL01020837.1.p1  ORF type:complete len:277 (-),score=32.38 GHVL01020837.1:93-923(-)